MAHVFKARALSLLQRLRHGMSPHRRHLSSAIENTVAVRLNHRSLLHIDGKDSMSFLQGLITNDIQQLSTESHSLYAMFLNTKGRVMYDALFYQNAETNGIYLECDTTVLSSLEKHLKMYRLRKHVDIRQMPLMDVWVVFNRENISQKSIDKAETGVTPCDLIAAQQNDESLLDLNALILCNVVLFRDPRLSHLGVRVICPKNENIASLLQLSLDNDINHYHTLRYKLGVGEGVADLPPGECFPLESNCDYLNGVSFHKGCYIGQELTARVHHTGVVRKRLMPIILESPLKSTEISSLQVLDAQDKVIGKMRSVEGTAGIALLRTSEALNATSLHVEGIKASTTMPPWWPCQVTKESDAKISS